MHRHLTNIKVVTGIRFLFKIEPVLTKTSMHSCLNNIESVASTTTKYISISKIEQVLTKTSMHSCLNNIEFVKIDFVASTTTNHFISKIERSVQASSLS